MPDNLNHALEGTILPTDYGVLSLGREKAQEVLSAVTAGSIGYAEKRVVEKLLSAKTYPISPKDMIGFKASAFNTDRCPLRHFLLSVFQLPIQGGRRENIF